MQCWGISGFSYTLGNYSASPLRFPARSSLALSLQLLSEQGSLFLVPLTSSVLSPCYQHQPLWTLPLLIPSGRDGGAWPDEITESLNLLALKLWPHYLTSLCLSFPAR